MSERQRRPGGGRKRLVETDATLANDLLNLIGPMTLGCPERPLLWVSKSLEKLAAALRTMGHTVSANTVRRLLRHLGFSRQGNAKANEGRGHPDRDAQFEHINARVLEFQAADQPVISVDILRPFENPKNQSDGDGRLNPSRFLFRLALLSWPLAPVRPIALFLQGSRIFGFLRGQSIPRKKS